MRMRLVLVVAALAVVVGGVLWWRSRESASTIAAAPKPAVVAVSDAGSAARLPTQPALPAEEVTAKQEAGERTQLEHSATELKATRIEIEKILAALAIMQTARRELFADLAARKRPIEEVSTKLRELRDQLDATFVKELGPERAAQLQQRIRAAHGFEAAPSSP